MRATCGTNMGTWEVGVPKSWDLGGIEICMYAETSDRECRYLKQLFTES